MSDILKKAMARNESEKSLQQRPADDTREKLEIPAAEQAVVFKPSATLSEPGLNRPISDKPKAGKATTRSTELNLEILDHAKIVHDCRTHPAADQVKILRAQMLHRLMNIDGNSVLVTSPRPGAGKTINAINVAISIAQEIDRTVLLIDANLRKPSVHKFFGIKEEKGLADFLLGKAEIPDLLINPGIEKLTILPAGRRLLTSSEMLGAARMADLVNEMKNRYEDRILVFDGPDVLTNADTLVFSRLVDGIILVVEAEKTTRQDVTETMNRLSETKLLGTIFNRAKD